jgi:hypothetical protein
MLRYSLALTTAPASEPVTLAEAKTWARIDGTDDDTTITALITAARQAAEQHLRRSLITQTWKITLDLSCSRLNDLPEGNYDLPISALYGGLPQSIPLPKGPVSSITSVVTYDLDNTASTFSAANYRLDSSGERLILNYGALWPSSIRAQAGCEVTYVAGYGAAASVPQPIKQGIMIHIASLYEQRGNCEDSMDLPPGTKMLLQPYRIMGDRLG